MGLAYGAAGQWLRARCCVLVGSAYL
jgi:hypothetical protein